LCRPNNTSARQDDASYLEFRTDHSADFLRNFVLEASPRRLRLKKARADQKFQACFLTYYGDLGESGECGIAGRLKLELLTRRGIETDETFTPQTFSLIITISDPGKSTFDEMAQIVRDPFQAQNLTVRASARIRAKL
jgi:hypothetical protein